MEVFPCHLRFPGEDGQVWEIRRGDELLGHVRWVERPDMLDGGGFQVETGEGASLPFPTRPQALAFAMGYFLNR